MIDLDAMRHRANNPNMYRGVALDNGSIADVKVLVEEVERLRADIIDVALAEIALDSRLEKAADLIKSVEWVYKSGGGSGALCCAFCRGLYPNHKLDCKRQATLANDLQPCGHPRSAIVSNVCGELISDYCGMCEAEAKEKQDG